MNEYVGKKVAVMVPAKSTLAEADIRPDALDALEKACMAKGLHATNVTLTWRGSWAEAIERGTLDAEYRDCKMDDFTVYLYEAVARESADLREAGLQEQFRVTVSSDDAESFETDTVLVAIEKRISKRRITYGLDEVLLEIGQQVVADSATRSCVAYAIVPAGSAADARSLALEALQRLGDVNASTLECIGPCTEHFSDDLVIDVIKYRADVTPRD